MIHTESEDHYLIMTTTTLKLSTKLEIIFIERTVDVEYLKESISHVVSD